MLLFGLHVLIVHWFDLSLVGCNAYTAFTNFKYPNINSLVLSSKAWKAVCVIKNKNKNKVYFLIMKYADGSAGSKLCIVVNCLDHALEGAETLLTCIFRYCSSESLKLSWLFWWPGINSEVTEQQQKGFSLSESTYAIKLNFKSCMIDNVMCIGVKMFFTALSKLQSFFVWKILI